MTTHLPTIVQCISCPDQPGIVGQVCQFVLEQGANITSLEQHVDHDDALFFMRLTWQPQKELSMDTIKKDFQPLATKLNMEFTCRNLNEPSQMAILVSKQTHCLYDILARFHSNQWNVKIPIIISNHSDCETICQQFSIPFKYLPINNNKQEQEQQILATLEKHQIDTIVLARYMQILSDSFVDQFPNKIINIHHSFLPAFIGAKPYHQAHERGVKMIGATSHYVTADLDQGPIIAQDTQTISHRNDTESLIHIGQDIEKFVLNQAISAHLEHKILVYKQKTIIFH